MIIMSTFSFTCVKYLALSWIVKKKVHLPTILLPGKRTGILILKKKIVLAENQFFSLTESVRSKLYTLPRRHFVTGIMVNDIAYSGYSPPCVKSLNIVPVLFGCTFCCRLSLERSDCETIALKFIITSLSNIL